MARKNSMNQKTNDYDLSNYTIDLDKFFEMVFASDNVEKREQEITDGFDVSGTTLYPVSKIIREIKSKGEAHSDAFRFDMLKTLLFEIIETADDEMFDGIKICINTLINYGILIENRG